MSSAVTLERTRQAELGVVVAEQQARRYHVAVDQLMVGMFVADLDRPWLDTPFLMQGFLIDKEVEIKALAKHCEYVGVDIELSTPNTHSIVRAADAISRAGEVEEVIVNAPHGDLADYDEKSMESGSEKVEPELDVSQQFFGSKKKVEVVKLRPNAERDFTPLRAPKLRSDTKVKSNTRDKFQDLIQATGASSLVAEQTGNWSSLVRWLKARFSNESDDREKRKLKAKASREAIKAFLPPGVKLQGYADARSVESELPRARATYAKSEETLNAVVAEIRSGKVPDLANVKVAVTDMVDSMIDNPDALIWVARLREESLTTYNHGVKVALYLIALGRHLGFPKRELSNLGTIGMLADLGKTQLPKALLEKPGMLTSTEFDLIKEHVRITIKILKKSMKAIPAAVEQGIAQHHERLDGSGYPRGLKGDEIGIYGRMTAIADCFAALITPRSYANPSAPQEALMNLYEWAGKSFHEPLVEQFVQAVGVFPIGSLIELSSGEVAVVVSHNRVKRLEPKVLVLTTHEKTPLSQPLERDLFVEKKSARKKELKILRGLPAGSYGLKLKDYYLGEIARENKLH
jgi:HD-GYP domain-containing protein (c-di-GMP phosphodiesterase class II)